MRTHGEAAGGVPGWLRSELARRELDPPGLTPSAVLVVRRVDGRLPRAVVGPSAARSALRGWEGGLRADLADLLGRAARPHGGVVPPGAPAVLFADHAEYLACLVADVLRGVATRWWWWEAALREAGGPDVASVLGSRVEVLPAVVDLLGGWRLAAAAVQRIDEARCDRLLGAVLDRFDLAAARPAGRFPGPAPGPGAGAPPPGGPPTGDTGSGPGPLPEDGRPAAARSEQPWARWLGPAAVPDTLSAGRARLLGVALLLQRAPGAARSSAVTAVLRAWADPPALVAGSDRPSRDLIHDDPVWAPAEPGRTGVFPPVIPGAVIPGAVIPGPGTRDADAAPPGPRPHPATAAAGPGSSGPALPSDDGRRRGRGPAGPGGPEALAPPGPSDTDQPDRAPAAPGPLGPDPLRTGLTGVLYAVHLITRARPADAADPRWRLTEIGGWGLLEVVARILLQTPPGDPGDVHDPLWRLLAHLDGREPGRPVGLGRAELALPDGPRPATPPPLLAGVADGTREWAEAAGWRLRDRLAAELDLPPAQAAARLRVPGLVFASRTHVDAVMDLASIDLAVRIAGLDRDPGWVPRLARVVTFHFRSGGLP
ncbi:hypothetical protein ACI79J_12865 [Geodermatophilus sp. SYSU D01062]